MSSKAWSFVRYLGSFHIHVVGWSSVDEENKSPHIIAQVLAEDAWVELVEVLQK